MSDVARPCATAAEHYLRGRPPYSAQLLDVMRADIGLDGAGTLLDVGCGPGVLAVELAPLFDMVIGIDPEPAMLAQARLHAAAQHVQADWIEARAEDLATLELPAARVVTFGQSIHWTDRQPVLATVYELLEPGGAVALIAPAIEHGSPPVDTPAPPIPHDQIEALIGRYLDGHAVRRTTPTRRRRSSHRSTRPTSPTPLAAPTSFARPTTSCPVTCRCPSPHPIVSATNSTRSSPTWMSCSPRHHQPAGSTTGPATPRSSGQPSPVDPLLGWLGVVAVPVALGRSRTTLVVPP